MKLVIEISEKIYDTIMSDEMPTKEEMSVIVVRIYQGIPLQERPHGEWVKGDPWTTGVGMGEQYGYWYTCSECGYKVKGGYTSCDIKFCQECGSDNRPKEG